MKIVENNVSIEEWNRFLSNNPDSTIYHTPEWKEFLEKTFDYEPRYFFAKNENDELIGIAPFFHVNSRITGNRLVSLPFSHICSPLGSLDVNNELLKCALSANEKLKSSTIEVRSLERFPGFSVNDNYSTFILKMTPRVDEVWNSLDRGSVRWAVKKSKNYGVTVEITNDIESIKDFFELNCITKRDIGVPGHPWKFVKNLFSCVKPYVSLYSAKLQGEIIAGGIMERFNGKVIYGYGAANPDHLKLYPYNAFIWKSIEDSCVNGYSTYDFGRTSLDNVGLIQFKKRWNTDEIKLYYNNQPEPRQTRATDRDSLTYKLGNGIIRRMPIAAYKLFSKASFSHFG